MNFTIGREIGIGAICTYFISGFEAEEIDIIHAMPIPAAVIHRSWPVPGTMNTPAMARHYEHEDHNVAVIRQSAFNQALASGDATLDVPPGMEIPQIDPVVLAGCLWNGASRRHEAEIILPPYWIRKIRCGWRS